MRANKKALNKRFFLAVIQHRNILILQKKYVMINVAFTNNYDYGIHVIFFFLLLMPREIRRVEGHGWTLGRPVSSLTPADTGDVHCSVERQLGNGGNDGIVILLIGRGKWKGRGCGGSVFSKYENMIFFRGIY